MNLPTRPTNLKPAGSRPGTVTIILSHPAGKIHAPPAGPGTKSPVSRVEAVPVAPDRRNPISQVANGDMMNASRNFLTVGRNLMAGCRRQIPGGQDPVDDLAAIVAGGCVRRILSGHDTGICTARDLKEARGWLKAAQGFVAVICEEKLADGDGRDLLRWLRQEKKIEIPFFLLCAHLPRFGRLEPGLELLCQPFHAEGLRQSFGHRGLLPGPSRVSSTRSAAGTLDPAEAAEGNSSPFPPS